LSLSGFPLLSELAICAETDRAVFRGGVLLQEMSVHVKIRVAVTEVRIGHSFPSSATASKAAVGEISFFARTTITVFREVQ
jgi:hypothetical protein